MDMSPFQRGMSMAQSDIDLYGLWYAVAIANFLPLWNMQHSGYRVAVDAYVGVSLEQLEALTDWSTDA